MYMCIIISYVYEIDRVTTDAVAAISGIDGGGGGVFLHISSRYQRTTSREQ